MRPFVSSLAPATLWDHLGPARGGLPAILAMVMAVGLLGEMLDIAVMAEIAPNLVVFDLGLDILITLLLPACYVPLILLAIAGALRGWMALGCGSAASTDHVFSWRGAPPEHVPIL